ncbi:iron export ABC transporter permease subunit FetB [Marinobacter sp. BGYM27]|uniref:ABC transporter permease n=1 Tax=unclassified Marinobacter TaxID=83889 RepID=UPI0021A39233|nr:iron export ABC transporter permease subunit FetB [Marinobacter sp. BGYM27]MDG5501639.1 iron export ABC transporter permease subunit FetB [Marinobacter sp. BGYM27]
MMGAIELPAWKLAIVASLVLMLGVLSHCLRLGIGKSLIIAGGRTFVQLSLVGLILESLFASTSPLWIALVALVMLLFAGREVMARQKRRLAGWWAYGIGTGVMFVSSFSVTIFALAVIGPTPWYSPQYAIPLLGMMLGNTMTGVALCLDRLTETAWQQRGVIESRLMLGETADSAIGDIRREAMRSGMMPAINAMAAAGIVSLPGMMTGQILAGTSPLLAVKYQILIMLTVTVGSGFGTVLAVVAGSHRLFDDRQRLRLDRLVTERR